MIEMTRLSLRLLRRHLALYAGCMVTLGATTVLASAQAALVAGLSHPEDVYVPGLSPEEVVAQFAALRGLLSVLSGLAIAISGFLMWSAVKQVVSFRQQELALMRLAGASRWRLAHMVFLECLAMGFVVALPSSFVGAALARPLFVGLQAIGFFGRGVEAHFGFAVGAALLITMIAALTAGIAGLLAARSATRGDLISAISPVAVHMSRVQVTWRLAFAFIGFACLLLLDTESLGPNLVLALPFLAVVPLFAIAPLLVPAGAWLIGRCVGIVAPGAGVLAAQRASKDRVRYARMATPVIVSVGVLGGFLVANAPDEQLRAETYNMRVAASAVAQVEGAESADRVVAALGPDSESLARLTSTKRSVSGDTRVLYFTDAAPFAHLLTQDVTEGDPAAVTGVHVASSVSGTELGDSLTVLDRDGQPVTLRVVAVIDDPLFEGVFIDWTELRRFVPDTSVLAVQVFASPITQPAASLAIQSSGVHATVMDRSGYIQQLEDARKANTYRSNIGIFGTIYLMSVISLVQSAVSGALARRREFRVLKSLGVGRRGILVTVGTEVIIVQLVAGVLVATVLVALGARFAAVNSTSAVAAVLSVAPVTATAYGSVAVVALASYLLGAWLALSRASEEAATRSLAEGGTP